ncbi:MAG: S24 family peptidase [Bacteroidales bacterium]|nr:S24 family peptidase [Bacteroidales bacterium]
MQLDYNTLYYIEVDDEMTITSVDNSIACGIFTDIGDYTDEQESLREFMNLRKGGYLGVMAHGDSMIDAGIEDGDTILIEPRIVPSSGDMVLARYENDYTIKYLYRDKDAILLCPANPDYSVITFPEGVEPEIIGVVDKVIKKSKSLPLREIKAMVKDRTNKQREIEILENTVREGLMDEDHAWKEDVPRELIAVWTDMVSAELGVSRKWIWAEKKWGLKNLRISYNNAVESVRFGEYDEIVKRILAK